MKDNIKMTGRLVIRLNGDIVREVSNIVVTSGKQWIASRMDSATAAVMSHMHLGTGSTSEAVGDTDLETPHSDARSPLDSVAVTTNSIKYTNNFAAGVCTGTITEAGVFNALTGGTMVARTTFGAITKGASDALQIDWTVTIN